MRTATIVPRATATLLLLSSVAVACGSDDAATTGARGDGPDGGPLSTIDGGTASDAARTGDGAIAPGLDGAASASAASKLAQRLRHKASFMVGMGNDLANDHSQDGAYTLGTTLDLHYAYLVGLGGSGGWPDWNSGGTFVNILADSAAAKGVTPMYTLYQMAAQGDGNIAVVTNDAYMSAYWSGAKLLFQRLGVFGKPAVVHLEPDFWGYAQQKSPDAKSPVHIAAHAPDCAGVTEDFAGMGHCLLILSRKYAPQAAVGFHASVWGGDVAGVVAFLKAIGAEQSDFIATDALDRDAGCFEAHVDPNCQRGGSFYLDETNQTSPNYREHFAWVKQIHDGLSLPVMWWQVPFGVPSATPGGTAGHYRDNHVHYFFEHVGELVAAGGVGAVFGTGAGNQTYITSDGDQFKNAVTKYLANPTPLP